MNNRAEMVRLLAGWLDEDRELADEITVLTRRRAGLSQLIQGARTWLAASLDAEEAELKAEAEADAEEDAGVVSAYDLSATPANGTPGTVARPSDYPRGAKAVRLVLMDTDRELSVKGIAAELEARGWAPHSAEPENAVAANAARAVRVFPDVVRRKDERGLVFFRRVPPDETGTSNVTELVRRVEAGNQSQPQADVHGEKGVMP